jgi:long-chain acyl-CoA synthetase
VSAQTARPWTASYAEGVPDDIEVTDDTLVDLIDQAVRTYPKHTALEFFRRETRYRDLGEQIARAAEGLRRLGVEAGDRVALVLPSCPQHVVAFYAVLRLGAIVVEHNPLYTPREMRHQFEDHGAKIAIAWDKTVELLQDLPSDLKLDAIVSVNLTDAMPLALRTALKLPLPSVRARRDKLTTPVRRAVPWDDLVSTRRLRSKHPRPTADDTALIQYTSGTTGTPKGAVLSHRNVVVNAAQARAWVPQVERGRAVVYGVLPLFHAYGLTLCLSFAMSMGARLVLFPTFDPDLVLPVMKKRPPTFLPAVPPIYARLTDAAAAKKVSLQGTAISISGAMPLSKEVVEPWEQATGGVLVEGYGLSETSPVLMANPVSDARRLGAVGLPLPGTEARVVDPDDPDADRAIGEVGELLVRGPQVFSGYWRKPDETAGVFVGDGWFRTGDSVSMDADGFFTIADRLKELIITGGFNVSPTEVEQALAEQRGVKEAAVVGMPSSHSGEDVVAAIVLEDGAEVDVEKLREAVRSGLAAYKVPRRIHVVDELPRSIIGKVLRKKVREQLVQREGGTD